VTDYWFDGKDRVVRRQSELAGASSATFTWARWGKPVSIKPPKAADVITLRRLAELQKRASARHG
jgi:hypothetical protein